ncbi:MAG: hypothetical protein E7562_00740 [Ruminococcaceae bacterium]|nr:hypothetical protein [Oscillospiraceae bacterium]
MPQKNIKKLAVSAMLTALAFLLTFCTSFFKVSGFLSLDLKDAVLSVISLMYGPLYGIISVLAVALLEFITISSTGVYGLIMNILASGTFVLVCGLVYKFKRDFFGAILAGILTVISVTAVMITANIFITPYYLKMPTQVVLDMILPILLPFNLFKSVLNSSLMLLIYKPFTTVLKKNRLLDNQNEKAYKMNKRSIILICVSALLVIIAISVMIYLGIEIK